MQLRHRRHRSAIALTAGLLAVVTGVSTTTASFAAGQHRPRAGAEQQTDPGADARGGFDARRGSGDKARAALLRDAARAASRPETRRLRGSLGDQALLDLDGATGTPRLLTRLDGFLTGRSSQGAAKVTLGYVADHHDALGLSSKDLKTFHLRRDYVDVDGTHHLSWTQKVGGVDVFGNGLQSAVTDDGRLVSLGGSPVSEAAAAPASATRLDTGDQAISAARTEQGDPAAPGARDTAHQVLFVTRTGTHLGWSTVTMSAAHPTLTVLDAHTGGLLFRRPLSSDATSTDKLDAPKAGSGGLAYQYFPRAPRGGSQVSVDYTAKGWLDRNATKLSGNNSHAYSDVNDDNVSQGTEEAAPSAGHRWDYALKPFSVPGVSFCDNPYPCSWDPNVPYSWQANRAQNVAQVFFYVNNWHDHLLDGPIGFTEAAGNFQLRNSTRGGVAGDAVDTQTDDGANTAAGLPDGSHIDNANMSTPPDGQAPTMQMYLQHQPGTAYPDEDPFSPTNVGDEADTVYHEYTHGLSNRLVVDASGNSTLGEVQAGSMGEAWSDWYAMDYLVDQGLQRDARGTADIVLFQYDGAGTAVDRTEPLDCKVGDTTAACTGGATGHTGGYTYADYGQVIGSPEVHADGEIWSQTLWDLRDALGSTRTEALVTRAMELSPSNPSFLDERNALLSADTVKFGGRDSDAIWKVFANRGMGYYAGSLGGDDSAPGADFHRPPASVRTSSITGTVTDLDSGKPAPGITVTLAFQGGNGTANPSAVTATDGSYTIADVPVGSYAKLTASGAGYDPATTPVDVTPRGTVKNFSLRRDYAASSGGATIDSFTGPDFGPACGPAQAIDNSQATGWGSTTGDDDGTATNVFRPKNIVIDLKQTVAITEIAVDPSATCGDGGSASTGQYSVETSTDRTTWTPAASGTFTASDRGRLNPLTPAGGSATARYVRFTILGNQTPEFATSCPGGAFSGCQYTDLTEIEVYGKPAA
ncbi:M36 family metallopeptidase [Nocardioides panacis]|uniref:M36 family metallopeptidase n=1 Tax=Nocardioides panacis TaxID=2849501 RepID=A0A975T0Y5_9ACTN|nr:M36 family metallopeptidase [Nocardioides panacis]QWZ09402.1 M36 family metallopeptidase [Nocardioides panacis]